MKASSPNPLIFQWANPLCLQCDCVLPVALVLITGNFFTSQAVEHATTRTGNDHQKIRMSAESDIDQPANGERTGATPRIGRGR